MSNARRAPTPRAPAGPRPWRTCLGCRAVRSQGDLLRLVRDADGSVEPDPHRRRGGRGAYLCRTEGCLTEAIRRARWGQAFRTSATLTPEAIGRVRALIEGTETDRFSTECGDDNLRAGAAVEGRW